MDSVSTESVPRKRTEMWGHQREALTFLAARRTALLAMAMGTGKSAVTVRALESRDTKRDATVVILCPKSVIEVWPEQFERHAEHTWRVVCLERGTCKDKADDLREALRDPRRPLAVVVNYESAWREPLGAALQRAEFDAVIYDEVHRIKDPGGRASKFCKALSLGTAKTLPILFRLGLTGTPMPHSPLDVYAQFRAIEPAVFGTSFTAFKARYAVMNPVITGKVDAYQNLDELAAKMGRHTFQVDASVLNLPDPVHTERVFDLSPRGRAVYREIEENLIAEVEAGTIVASNALAKLLRLRQVTGGTTRTEDGTDVSVDDGKADALAEVLADLPLREPLVIVAVFHADLDRIREVCEASGRTVLELSGRRNELAAWKSGAADVLAVQIQAGGVGIDLTRACHSILWSVGFSLGEYEQFLARTQRPGQTRFVNYIHLLARGTVDFAVYRALRARASIVESVLATMKGRKAA